MNMKATSLRCPAEASSRVRACESCREAKVRCRLSQQPGVCQKCFDTKKECIARAGPRTRRTGRAVAVECDTASSRSLPTPAKEIASSATFSIDFAVAAQPEPDDSLGVLLSMHEKHIDSILPSTEESSSIGHDVVFSDRPPSPALSPSSSLAKDHSITDLDGKPQFNLSSAESMLANFYSKIPQLPCINLPPETGVRELAATRPFLLLAILSSASGSRTLQGHSLYDAEFRKVLGLKFVAAGERTLDLLQGLLVYCIWYPFQLRPESKHMFRCVRIAGDLVHDLGLDEDNAEQTGLQGSEEHLDGLRAYLGYYYLESVLTSSWRPLLGPSTSNVPWALKCCDTLEHYAKGAHDIALAALARLGVMNAQASTAIYESEQQTEEQRRLLLLGLQTRSQELQHRMTFEIASSTPVKLATLYFELYLNVAGLLQRYGRHDRSRKDEALEPEPLRLTTAVGCARRFLDFILALDQQALSALTAIDWCRIILAIIISMRLSLPLAACPGFDTSWARSEVRLAEFLAQISSGDGRGESTLPSATIDAMSATRAILRVVWRKFEERVAAALDTQAEAEAPRISAPVGCPLLSGNFDQYMSAWDAEFGADPLATTSDVWSQLQDHPTTGTKAGSAGSQPVFHDIWATMTVGWAGERS